MLTIYALSKIYAKLIAQKLLNAAMLFKDHVFNKTAMCDVGDDFAADI